MRADVYGASTVTGGGSRGSRSQPTRELFLSRLEALFRAIKLLGRRNLIPSIPLGSSDKIKILEFKFGFFGDPRVGFLIPGRFDERRVLDHFELFL